MKDTKLAKIKMIYVIAVTIVVVCYTYFAAPYFLDNMDTLRAENKQMEHDLKEIKKIGTDTSPIEESIKNNGAKLKEYEKSTEVDNTSFDMDISKKADTNHIVISEIAVENSIVIGQKKVEGKLLYRQPLTITFEGTFDHGIDFIESLENSPSGIYSIKDFVYSTDPKKKTQNWMMTMDAYYYALEQEQ